MFLVTYLDAIYWAKVQFPQLLHPSLENCCGIPLPRNDWEVTCFLRVTCSHRLRDTTSSPGSVLDNSMMLPLLHISPWDQRLRLGFSWNHTLLSLLLWAVLLPSPHTEFTRDHSLVNRPCKNAFCRLCSEETQPDNQAQRTCIYL